MKHHWDLPSVPSLRLLEEGDADDEAANEENQIEWDIECSLEISNDSALCGLDEWYGESCPTATDDPSSLDLLDVAVPFDYEIYYTSDEVPLDFVQGRLLQLLAAEWGLENCLEPQIRRFEKERGHSAGDDSRTRTLRDDALRQLEEEDVDIQGISTGAEDYVDDEISCNSSAGQAPTKASVCSVVHGQIHIKYSVVEPGTNTTYLEDTVTTATLAAVSKIMQEDSLVTHGSSGSLLRVVYLGQSTVFNDVTTVSPKVILTHGNDTSKGLGPRNGILLSLLASAVLVVVFAIVVRRKGARDSSDRSEASDEESCIFAPPAPKKEFGNPPDYEKTKDDIDSQQEAPPVYQEDNPTVRRDIVTVVSYPESAKVLNTGHDTTESSAYDSSGITTETSMDYSEMESSTSILEQLSEPSPVTSWIDDHDEHDHEGHDTISSKSSHTSN
eukprot:Nitzschia sp. Nitz4//scaffold108_size72880//57799//59200//NITZ4_005827-RA/size72880-augustus-gene-0.29-mRNA-1//1//CDS//3329532705//3290//frame0